jgi:hypothetical protein
MRGVACTTAGVSMRRPLLAISVLVLIVSSVFLFAGTAGAHTGQVISADCTQASASFSDFAATDHPISFQVSVLGGPTQSVAAVESPPNFVGAGTASADISSLTAVLHGSPGSIVVFAEWSAGRTDTATVTVTCGTPPPPSTTTPPPPPPPPPSTASPPPPTTASPPPSTTASPPPPTTTPPSTITPPPPPPPTITPPSPPLQTVSVAPPPPATPVPVNPATAG